MIEVLLNDRLGKKVRVKCKCPSPFTHSPLPPPLFFSSRRTNPTLLTLSPLTPPLPCSGNEDDTIGDLKKLVAAQIGTRPEKIKIQKWYTVYKDHITLEDYEIHDGMNLEMYYN